MQSESMVDKFGILSAIALIVGACGGGSGGSGGSGSGSVNTPTPTLSISVNNSTVDQGSSVTLTWSSSNADACIASGDWSGSRPVSGSETIGPIQSNQTFSLSCSGVSGGVMRSIDVGISGRTNLSVDRNLVRPEQQATLTWNAVGADSCTASGAWNGNQPTSGSYTTDQLSEQATYSLSCQFSAQTDIESVTVDVADMYLRWRAPSSNVDGTPLTDLSSYNIYWGSSSRNYQETASVAAGDTDWHMEILPTGEYYLTLTAVNAAGEESDYSNEVVKTLP